jgi:excisionase family DNA binding protein
MSVLLEQQLAELREDVKRLLSRAETPRVMRYEKAAKLLDCSVSKVRSLIRDGEIVPVTVGGRRMVPLSEVERISTPRLNTRVVRSVPKVKRDGKADGEAIRALMKKLR